MKFPEWTPDCGGDWCLSDGKGEDAPGVGYFANYWPDNSVSASIYVDGEEVADSGIMARGSKAQCMALAEQWIAERLAAAEPHLSAAREAIRRQDS